MNNQSQDITRRQAIQTSIATASAAVTINSLTTNAQAESLPVPQPKARIYKAVKGIGRHNADTAQAVFAKYKAMGFDGMESGNPKYRDAYVKATKATGFQFHGVVCPGHWGNRLSHPDEAIRNKGRASLESSIKKVHILGGSAVLIVVGRVNGANETHDHVWHRSMAEINKVIPLAAAHGIHILVETVWNGFTEDPETYKKYLDAFNSPWVGAYFDIGNMQKFAPAHEWIRILGKRIVKLDIKDWGKKNGFCRLGEGDVDWDKVREELNNIGFTGWATREGRDKNLQDTSKLMDQLVLGKK